LNQGEIVVATLRKPEVLQELSASYPEDKLLVLKVDVTNPTDIHHAFARTKEVFGRLDVVFNNAGSVIVGEAEMTPIDDARALFDVNFWGAVRVSQETIKFFREVNEPGRGGILLQSSSLAGFAGPPAFSIYAARYV
jgi:NAD(P)-dependent dehydrogenase (short-subunit alcohol dehydrogenase family)